MNQRQEFHNLEDLSGGIRRQLAEGMTARVFAGDRAMLSVVDAGPRARGRIHSHPEEQWGVLLRGTGVRMQGGEAVAVRAGDFWRTPGGIEHGFTAGATGARILEIFSPPRREYTPGGGGIVAERGGQDQTRDDG